MAIEKKLERRFPETQQEAEEAARMLEKEMDQLSLEERERNMFDVHGLEQSFDEDPPDVDRHIEKLVELVTLMPGKESYQKALYFNKEYVHGKKFLLMFLRADRFNIGFAAKRLLLHFTVKERLFGAGEILGRDIRMSDLSAEDMVMLESGCMQLLPMRDLAGRSVYYFSVMHRPKGSTLMSLNRAYWYLHYSTYNDEETQKKGVVFVTFNVGAQARAEPNLIMTQLDSVIPAIPKKVMGIHFCFDDDSLRPYVVGVHLFLDKALKGKFRAHFGNDSEFMLQTYGIPTSAQPIHHNGDISLAWHREWLSVRRVQEEKEGVVDGEIVPRKFDVLFGRGKGTREHTGNLRAVHVVEIFQEQYERADNIRKTEIASRVVTITKESFGRFLKWDGDKGWVEVSDLVARNKVSHFFRRGRSMRALRAVDSKPTDSDESTKNVKRHTSPNESRNQGRVTKLVRAGSPPTE